MQSSPLIAASGSRGADDRTGVVLNSKVGLLAKQELIREGGFKEIEAYASVTRDCFDFLVQTIHAI